MTGPKPDPTGAKILDGATRVLGDFGFKRATVELVAKYSGVSHMTIYRRWPSKNDLLNAAVAGEFSALLETAFAAGGAKGTSFADRALAAFAETVWAVQNHPVVVRELAADAGEQSPILAGTSDAVMQTGVPLVAGQLRHLGAADADLPADLDQVADVFVRLAYSLVVVKRPDRPLTSRDQVEEYAGEGFGVYLQALGDAPAPPAVAANVVYLDAHRPSAERPRRMALQLAAASIFSVLTIGAGLSAVLSGNIKLPFVTPANSTKPSTASTSTDGPSESPRLFPAPDQQVARAGSGSPLPAPPARPAYAGPAVPSPATPPAGVPLIQADQGSSPALGVPGANSGANNPGADVSGQRTGDYPAPVLQPQPGPQPGPQPAGPPGPPGPNPPGPPPAPAPGPPPGPKPPGPGPKPPGPGPQQQPGPGPQQKPGPGPGPQQPGPGPQQKPGPGPQ